MFYGFCNLEKIRNELKSEVMKKLFIFIKDCWADYKLALKREKDVYCGFAHIKQYVRFSPAELAELKKLTKNPASLCYDYDAIANVYHILRSHQSNNRVFAATNKVIVLSQNIYADPVSIVDTIINNPEKLNRYSPGLKDEFKLT